MPGAVKIPSLSSMPLVSGSLGLFLAFSLFANSRFLVVFLGQVLLPALLALPAAPTAAQGQRLQCQEGVPLQAAPESPPQAPVRRY